MTKKGKGELISPVKPFYDKSDLTAKILRWQKICVNVLK